jgi:serine/threonine-protein kinase
MGCPHDPSRGLLFGLLALQVGLVEQGQLVAAFQAWARDKARSLADHLIALGHLDDERRAAVEAMVALHLKLHGDVERSLAAVPAGNSTRERLAALADPVLEATLSHVGSGSAPTDGDADRTRTYQVGTATSDGLRFRVLRPHARGGLGTVFVALDEELHREVALKQILDQHADDPVSRQRFLLEAEITGGLEHPGIVPVYGLGTYGDGRPYYAMRFIRGDSLKEAITRSHADESLRRDPGRRSLELRKLLRRFTDVCYAIEYAHSRGVLHRDIKPGNVIVGKHGETLVVDWGLAKATGHAEPATAERTLMPSSASGSAETLPGQALGTPAYMSPEQARGDLDRLGPRSDVYALGATLYCLMTGKAPFDGDVAPVLRQVERGDFRPPRNLDPSIDRALEAIVLKAMAVRAEDRYASCRALAEDVERWMAGEPVAAYAEPWTRTLTRWLARHRTGVTGVAAAGLALMMGLAAVAAVQAQGKAALAVKNGELEAANRRVTQANVELGAANGRITEANADLEAANAKVRQRYDLAFEAIKTFHTGVSEDFLLQEEKLKDLRDRLLRSAQDFYGKLSALLGRDSDLASRRALARSNFELASLTDRVGNKRDALAAHRAVLAAREALAALPGADMAATVDVGRSLIEVATLLEAIGKTDEALATYRRAESLLRGVTDPDPASRAALATCRSQLGSLLSTLGRDEDALAVLGQARDEQEALADAPGAPADARADLATTLNRIGIRLAATGRPADAERVYRRVLEVRRVLADDHPDASEYRFRLASTHVNLGILLSSTGRPGEAEAEYRQALSLYAKLVADHPAVTSFRARLAIVHNNLGVLLEGEGRLAEAEAQHREALAIRQGLVAEHPDVAALRSDLGISRRNLGVLLRHAGRPAEAEAEHREALQVHARLVADHPDVVSYRRDLARAHESLGIALGEMGQSAAAEAEYRRAQAIHEGLVADRPTVTEYRNGLAISRNNLGVLLEQAGKPVEAEAEYRLALQLYVKLAADEPTVIGHRDTAASVANNLAVALRRTGRPAESLASCDQALALREALVAEHPGAASYRLGLAADLVTRSLARRALGDPAGAADDLGRALEIFEASRSMGAEQTFYFACARATLAALAGREGSGVPAERAGPEADEAVVLLRKAMSMGYRQADAYRTEDALDPLRDREDFKAQMAELERPAAP